MKIVPFIAESAAAALSRIHEQLGPDAVVLSVRPLPARGLARLWKKFSAVEALACAAEPEDLQLQVQPRSFTQAESVPCSAASCFATQMLPALHDGSARPHVFIGPPGTGKTTLLCKWMTSFVLNEDGAARVWRLDGVTANTAEFLNIYAEMLGAPVERFWKTAPGKVASSSTSDEMTGSTEMARALLLIDIPGVPPQDAEALRALRQQLSALPSPRIHLVLNGAYDTSILCQQLRAFGEFQPEDLSFTHLDEQPHQDKLAEVILGTNCCIRFLSTGQKIPGGLAILRAGPLSGNRLAA